MAKKDKHIGIVKWFHDKAKNANYGFIQHAKLGDLFFHENSIEKGQDVESFRENAVVVFIPQQSLKHKDKLEAKQVKYLATETDIDFLFDYFLSILTEKAKLSNNNLFQKEVYYRLKQSFELEDNKKKNDDAFKRFQFYFENNLQTIIQDITYLKELLRICKDFFPVSYKQTVEKVEQIINEETAHNLWLEKYIETCQVNYISRNIFELDTNTQQIIFNECNEEDKTNIFIKTIYSLNIIDNEIKFGKVKEILNLLNIYAKELYDKLLTETLSNCHDYFKLKLWLEEFNPILDFHKYKLFINKLSSTDQKKFVKKVFNYIKEEKITLAVEELMSINAIDHNTRNTVNKSKILTLDYSTCIILNTINGMHSKKRIETRKEINEAQLKIYDIIIKQIKEPDDILKITGYFDECGGRCSITVEDEKNTDGEIINKKINFLRHEYSKPRNICDGRKAIDQTSNNPALSEENGVEFWWCGNQKCYKPSRQIHPSSEWEKYTLLDFLSIMKIQYNEKDYEVYLSLINKSNLFLKHLKCHKCNYILIPIKQSNYAFYGVNEFHCTNETCIEKGKRIYLTHCLNGSCDHTIDSRISVKCKPLDHDSDKCGWYICNYCNSCCSDEGISRRVYILERTGQKYNCHTKGHRNIGTICCNKCGNPMDDIESNEVEYNKALNWFKDNRENKNYIAKSGQIEKGRRMGKLWFRFKKYNLSQIEFNLKLKNLVKLGFNIPNLEESEKEIQLVSEKDNFQYEKLICSNKKCGHLIDLSNDIEKAYVMKRFHSVRFESKNAKM